MRRGGEGRGEERRGEERRGKERRGEERMQYNVISISLVTLCLLTRIYPHLVSQYHARPFFFFIFHADDVKREICLYSSRLLANQKRQSVQSMG